MKSKNKTKISFRITILKFILAIYILYNLYSSLLSLKCFFKQVCVRDKQYYYKKLFYGGHKSYPRTKINFRVLGGLVRIR